MPATMSLAAILADSAVRFPDHPAVCLGGTEISYSDMWHQARQTATVLAERGIGVGDRVALLLPNTPDFPRCYFAVLSLGAVVVPVHALLKAEEICYVLEDSGAKLLICAGPLLGEGAKGAELAGIPVMGVLGAGEGVDHLDELAAAAEPVRTYVSREPTDTAVILYTSGTTGKPKGAQISHFNVLMNVDASVLSSFDISSSDRVLGCLPLFHTFGQTCTLNTSFRVGACVVLLPRFDGASALTLLIEENCTIFMGVPTMYVGLLEAARTDPRRPSSLRYALSGGAGIPVAILERFAETFDCPVLEGYGLTETSPVATFNQKGFEPIPGTVGRPIWGVEVEIAAAEVEDRIELLPHGEVGEVVVRGHCVMTGYLNKPEETAKAIVDGWFRTGDLGTKDDADYIRIVDRKKDMVLRGGYNVYPTEVEGVLVRHPGVGQVAVIGLPDDKMGEEITAVVVRSPEGASLSADELIAWSREHLAAYKYPRHVHFADSLPLGPSGKVLKRELVADLRG